MASFGEGEARWAAILFLAIAGVTSASAHGVWRIKQDHWSDADEKGFGEFVAAIGEISRKILQKLSGGCCIGPKKLVDEQNPHETASNVLRVD